MVATVGPFQDLVGIKFNFVYINVFQQSISIEQRPFVEIPIAYYNFVNLRFPEAPPFTIPDWWIRQWRTKNPVPEEEDEVWDWTNVPEATYHVSETSGFPYLVASNGYAIWDQGHRGPSFQYVTPGTPDAWYGRTPHSQGPFYDLNGNILKWSDRPATGFVFWPFDYPFGTTFLPEIATAAWCPAYSSYDVVVDLTDGSYTESSPGSEFWVGPSNYSISFGFSDTPEYSAHTVNTSDHSPGTPSSPVIHPAEALANDINANAIVATATWSGTFTSTATPTLPYQGEFTDQQIVLSSKIDGVPMANSQFLSGGIADVTYGLVQPPYTGTMPFIPDTNVRIKPEDPPPP